MPISIYILTTEGPVRIQRVAEEADGIQSVICLDGRAQALPISSRYDAFVRNPTGVIERETGHRSYRVDVDGAIDDGESWQLGLYLAHLISNTDTVRDIHIFATGEVDRDLRVRAVGHVSEKLMRAEDLILQLQAENAEVFVFTPRDGAIADAGNPKVPSTQLDSTGQALGAINLPKISQTRAAKHSLRFSRNQMKAAGLVVFLLAAWLLWKPTISWQGIASDGELLRLEEVITEAEGEVLGRLQAGVFLWLQEMRRPNPDELNLTGTLTLSDHPDDCGETEGQREITWDTGFAGDNTVCKLVVEGHSSEPGSSVVGRMGYWPDGLEVGGRPERTMRGSAQTSGRTWTLEFERYPAAQSLVRLVVLIGPADPKGSQPWFSPLLSEPQGSNAFQNAKLRVMRLGYAVSVHEWRHSPPDAN